MLGVVASTRRCYQGASVVSNLDRFKNDLERLIAAGKALAAAWYALRKKRESPPNFSGEYQRWYSEAHEVVRQLLPARQEEFERLYLSDPRRKSLTSTNYAIQDWVLGVRSGTNYANDPFFDDYAIALMRFNGQLEILSACMARLESSLFEMKQLVTADLFDSEVEAARELVRHGFLRAAGAVCGRGA
jgi:hypothetical protein